MSFDVVLEETAEKDIRDIWNYIANHDSEGRADYVVTTLEEKIALLTVSPNVGNVPKELQRLGLTGYRELHWKPYRIVYRVQGSRVLVDCVLDGRRDMDTLLRQRLVR